MQHPTTAEAAFRRPGCHLLYDASASLRTVDIDRLWPVIFTIHETLHHVSSKLGFDRRFFQAEQLLMMM
jgi:hypothetical protein